MGKAVKRVSMRAGVKKWSNQNDLDLGEDMIDDLAYSLRAIAAQLMNMKAHSRPIPRQWAPKFETLYAKLDVHRGETAEGNADVAAIEDGDDEESDDCEIVCKIDPDVDVVSIAECDDGEPLDASKLFDSDDPALSAILRRGHVRKRVTTKSPMSCYPIGPLDPASAEMPTAKLAKKKAGDDKLITTDTARGGARGPSEDAAQEGLRRQPEHHGHGEGEAPVPDEDAAQGGQRRQGECDGHVVKLQRHWQVGECSAPVQRRRAGRDGYLKVVSTSSLHTGSGPGALSALQLLAKGVRTGCALSPAEWAKVSKLTKEQIKGHRTKTMKRKEAAARGKASCKKL